MESNRITEIAGRGRCIVAGKSYSPGELILCEEPYTMVVAEAYAEVACSYCGVLCVNGTMYALSSESCIRYCSEKCITADYPVHSIETAPVAVLKKLGVQGHGMDSMRLVFRIGCCRKLEQTALLSKDTAAPSTPINGRSNKFQHVQLLEANTLSMTKEMALAVSETSAELAKIGGRFSLPLTSADAEALLYTIQCNAHQIVNHNDTAVALGLFPYTSMMNHSCCPNCIHRFLIEPGRPPRLIMRALEHISEGQELCYSYVNLYQSTSARQSQLSSAYSFRCICLRCSAGENTLKGASEPDSSTTPRGPSALNSKNFSADDAIDALEPLGMCERDNIEESEKDVRTGDDIERINAFVTSVTVDMSSSESNVAIDALDRLRDFMGSHTLKLLHPANRTMFQCYHFFSLSAVRISLENQTSFGKSSSYRKSLLKTAIGFGLLALGCMRKYVRTVQTEIGHLEGLLAKAIEELFLLNPKSNPNPHPYKSHEEDQEKVRLKSELELEVEVEDLKKGVEMVAIEVGDDLIVVNQLPSESKSNDDFLSNKTYKKESNIEANSRSSSSSRSNKFQSISSMIFSQGYLGQFFWVVKKDPRILNLLDWACLNVQTPSILFHGPFLSLNLEGLPATPAIDSEEKNKSLLDSERTERALLESLLIALKESSRNIAFICRAEEETEP